MKNSTVVLTMCLGFACTALAQERPPIRPALVSDPLPSADAATYPFTVIYESDVPLDLESLGDDDVVVGTQTLLSFRREIGQPPTLANFVSAEADDAGTRVVAIYELARPQEGWDAWKVPRLSVDTVANSVFDSAGNGIARWALGFSVRNGLDLSLETVPDLKVRQLERVPQVEALAPAIDFQVVYEANYALDPDLFEGDEIRLVNQGLREFKFEESVGMIALPMGSNLEVEVVSVDAVDSNRLATVTYRAQRPEAGWSPNGLDLLLMTEPFNLGANGRGWYSVGGRSLGYIHPLAEGEPNSALEALSITSETQAQVTFDVIYEHPSGIALESLGDDDLTTLPVSESFVLRDIRGDFPDVRPRLTASESNADGTRVTASYVLDRPEAGWASLGAGSERVYISNLDGGVETADGTPSSKALLGFVQLDFDADLAAQIVGFDAWVENLGESLGFDQPITLSSDADGDGSGDVLEVALGSNPVDASEVPRMSPELIAVDEQSHFQMTLNQPRTVGVATSLEGSADGESWDYVLPLFTAIDTGDRRRTTIRSILPARELPFQYFRVRVTPIR